MSEGSLSSRQDAILPHSLEACATSLFQGGRLRVAVIKAVEEQFERAMGLVAEVDLGTQHDDLSLSDGSLRHCGAAVQILLAPGPATIQNFGAGEPRDRGSLLQLRV